jgi:hypothetical protein
MQKRVLIMRRFRIFMYVFFSVAGKYWISSIRSFWRLYPEMAVKPSLEEQISLFNSSDEEPRRIIKVKIAKGQSNKSHFGK